MFEQLRLIRRPRRLLWLVGLVVLAMLAFVPLRNQVSSSSSIQRQERGILRGRLAKRLGERRDGGRASRGRNQSPPSEAREIAGMQVAIWRPSDRGRAPLLLFSHGLNGCNTQSTSLMQKFADRGYLVVAPSHNDASCGRGGPSRPEEKLRQPGRWSDGTYRERGEDLRRLLDGLRRDALNSQIDWNRIGLVGHSLGGYTALAAAGAWPNWRLPNIKAVVAWSPYCAPFVERGHLEALRIPVMYQGGTRDFGITPSVKKSAGCFDKTSSPAIFVEFSGAGHFAWTDLQDSASDLIAEYSLEFLDKYVRGIAGADPTEQVAGVSELRVK
jgi:predicted dienelactone hydrolase